MAKKQREKLKEGWNLRTTHLEGAMGKTCRNCFGPGYAVILASLEEIIDNLEKEF